MLDVDALLRPYFDRLAADVGGLDLYDAHTHVGANDPDGFTQTPEQLLKALGGARARGVVFPMHEPEGYREANDFVIDAAAASEGTVVPVLPRGPARQRGGGGHARPGRRRPRDQAAPPRGAVRPRRARRARPRRARARAARARPDPRGPRHPGARPAHRRAERRVPGRQADPGPRRDLRPRVAVEGHARAPEPVRGHRVVEPGRPDGAVLPCAAVTDPLGERLAVRAAGDVRRGGAALRAAGRAAARGGALDRGRPDGAAAGGRAGRRRRPAAARRAPARPAPRARRHPPRDRDGPGVRPHRPRGADRARAARLRRRRPTRSARRSARPCSTCSTSTRSTGTCRRPTAARSRRPGASS